MGIFRLFAASVICLLAVTPASAENTDAGGKWNTNCIVFQGGPNNFGAAYGDPNTHEQLESAVILQNKEPTVERKTTERGLLRKFCEKEIIEYLGSARARQIMRLTD